MIYIFSTKVSIRFLIFFIITIFFFVGHCAIPESRRRSLRHVSVRVLALRLAAVLPLKKRLAVLVELELRDDHLRWADANLHRLAVRLVASDALDVDNPLLAVDLRNLPLTVVVMAARDLNLVILANRHSAHVVLVPELLRQRGGHQDAPLTGRRLEVRLAGLTAGGRHVRVVLHGKSRVEMRIRL